MAIGERIKRMRNLRKMTQKQLGIMIGFSPNTADVRIAQYETGKRTPKGKYVEAIASLLGVEESALTVPDIDTYLGLYQTLFALEDVHGIRIKDIDGEKCLTVDIYDRTNSSPATISDFFRDWCKKAEELSIGEITQEQYDDWRYNYPRSVVINRDKKRWP
ncbi:MAG: helix-turn-helix domain-containing protein [Clostridiales Family XIII bacterium]|jgi:transcriptional regulator with XRE-family HTH domain|nr:helix-turn-helix domain-containing protein [Clostridiales Family XIII bacterium]